MLQEHHKYVKNTCKFASLFWPFTKYVYKGKRVKEIKKKQGRKDIEKSKEHFTRFTEHDTKKKASWDYGRLDAKPLVYRELHSSVFKRRLQNSKKKYKAMMNADVTFPSIA